MLRNITLLNCTIVILLMNFAKPLKRDKKKEKLLLETWGDGLERDFSVIFMWITIGDEFREK